MSAEAPRIPQQVPEIQPQETQSAYWLREHSGAEGLYVGSPIQLVQAEQVQDVTYDTEESVAVARDAVAGAFGPESVSTGAVSTGGSTEGSLDLPPAWPLGNGEKVSRKQTKEAVRRYNSIAISPDGKSATELGEDGATRSVNTVYAKRIREMANVHHAKEQKTSRVEASVGQKLSERLVRTRKQAALAIESVMAPSKTVHAAESDQPTERAEQATENDTTPTITTSKVIRQDRDARGRERKPILGFDEDFAKRLLEEMGPVFEINKANKKRFIKTNIAQKQENVIAMANQVTNLKQVRVESMDEHGKPIVRNVYFNHSGTMIEDQDTADKVYYNGRKYVNAGHGGYNSIDRDSNGDPAHLQKDRIPAHGIPITAESETRTERPPTPIAEDGYVEETTEPDVQKSGLVEKTKDKSSKAKVKTKAVYAQQINKLKKAANLKYEVRTGKDGPFKVKE